MKKKLIVSAFALMFAMVSMESEVKHYSDKAKGYGGWAGAKYLGTTRTVDLGYYDTGDFVYDILYGEIKEGYEKDGFVITEPATKISKEENFLAWSSLGEYDIEDGEVYEVCLQCENSERYLNFVAEICEKGTSFIQYGGFYFKEK